MIIDSMFFFISSLLESQIVVKIIQSQRQCPTLHCTLEWGSSGPQLLPLVRTWSTSQGDNCRQSTGHL